MIKFTSPKVILAICSTLLISGCGVLAPISTPETKQYQILPPNLQTQKDQGDQREAISQPDKSYNLTLFVTPLTAAEPYNSTVMYYRENTSYQLLSYSENSWAVPPQQMLSRNTLQALLQFHNFKNVVSSNFIGYADYRLTGNLNQLTQLIQNGNSSVILSVTYTLTNANSGKVVAIQTFDLTEKSDANAKGFAIATNKLSQTLTRDINSWLVSQKFNSN
ncbi:ABC-type transport auxiliary lipoprotein family protein [Fastidiosibacter lacustris]|uniref:ABC-type transport auxiliary lipoprotein family protein n=1 Tax=Fastidiosibacter lacustris TaxID=2056695 RepID=UPI000E34E8FD|nr:ABC-type transport auxiliary lipoprotein family protein [Fastidiosibacter lacustris]